jgi:acyl carrier protein
MSINWGTWEEMRVATEEARSSVAQYGLKPLPLDQALGVLGDLIAGIASTAKIAVASVDWKLLKPAYEARRQRPFLEYLGLSPSQDDRAAAVSSSVSSLQNQLETALPEEHYSIILAHVAGLAASVLGASNPDMLDIHQGLFEMGMDSLMSVELKTRLEKSIGKPLPSTLTFNYPTIAELTEYITSAHFSIEKAKVTMVASNPLCSWKGFWLWYDECGNEHH